MILAKVLKDRAKVPKDYEECVICSKQSKYWKPIGPHGDKVPCCKKCYNDPELTKLDWLNGKIWYDSMKGGYEGKKCYLCSRPVIAFVDIALDKAFAEDLTADDLPDEWVQNIQPVCDNHATPDERNEFLANRKD